MSPTYYITDAPHITSSDASHRLLSAYEYISDGAPRLTPGARLFNACLDQSYLSVGYYVGLLAQARGHQLTSSGPAAETPIDRPASATRHACRTKRSRLGILHSPSEPFSPSGIKVISQFSDYADSQGLDVSVISKDQISALPHLDGLFIRDFTSPTNSSFRFAKRAIELGIPVIDDPDSILRCSNKVFINELCLQHGIRTPKTLVVTPAMNFDFIAEHLGAPFVLKLPDGSFSLDVHKIENAREWDLWVSQLRRKSAILCAQEFMPTEFDWRVATLKGKALFACKYFMADGHWQINKHQNGDYVEGSGCAVVPQEAPLQLIQLAEKISRLVGDGLYGVDIKEHQGQYYLIEINDNPNIDELELADSEDVWEKITDFFKEEINCRREQLSAPSKTA